MWWPTVMFMSPSRTNKYYFFSASSTTTATTNTIIFSLASHLFVKQLESDVNKHQFWLVMRFALTYNANYGLKCWQDAGLTI